MNILYITPYYKPSWFYGGPPRCIAEQAEYLVKHHGLKIDVLTLNINGSKPLYNSALPVIREVDDVTVHYLPVTANQLGKAYFESNFLYDYINKFAAVDLIHVHTLFNAFSRKGMHFAFRKNIPYIVTPHGMLDSFSLTRSKWMKMIHRLLFDDKLLSAARAVQFTTANEMKFSVINQPVNSVILPLGFEFPDKEPALKPPSNGTLKLIFLGRINRKKGIDLLIKGIAKADKIIQKHLRLDIYGADDDDCKKDLERLIASCYLQDQIHFCGSLDPEIRDEKLKEYDCLVLTSHQENFGLVVTEALAMALPVYVSDKVNLCDFILENNCGWVSTLDVDDITHMIHEIYHTASRERHLKGVSGYDAVRKNFSMHDVASRYVELYNKFVSSSVTINI